MRLISYLLLCSFTTMASVSFAETADSKLDSESPGQPPLIQSDYQQLPSNNSIISYLKQWSNTSSKVAYVQLGESAGGRPLGGLLISSDAEFLSTVLNSEEKKKNPEKNNQHERLRVMIVGGQHGNESAGPEGIQQIIYEMLTGSLQDYPSKMDLIIVPNASPDGRDLMIRENANGVNTNTDYIQLSQPESRVLRKALIKWQPHTIIDVHESKAYKEESLALQGYVTVFEIQYEVGFEPNMDKRLRAFGVDEFLPGLIKKVNTKNLRAARYLKEIVDINSPVTHGGITLRNFRNYAGFHHSFSVLVEGRLDPPDEDYPTPLNIKNRSDELYISIEAYLQRVHETADRIKTLTKLAKSDWQGLAKNDQLVLESEYSVDPAQSKIQVPLLNINKNNIEDLEFNYHSQVVVNKSLLLPKAYVVTSHQDRIAELLARHGIVSKRVKETTIVDAEKRKISDLKTIPPLRGRGRYEVTFSMTSESEKVSLKPDDLWINLDQDGGRLVPLLLEPSSTTSIFAERDFVNTLTEGDFFVLSIEITSE